MGRGERGEFYFLLYKLHSLILLLYFDKIKMINKKIEVASVILRESCKWCLCFVEYTF